MIQLQKITKSFGSRVLFDKLTFQFPEREKIALFGSNGAGKSTLLNIICGLEAADSGEVVKPADARIGYLPQIPNQNPEKSILAECLTGAREIHKLEKKMQELEARLIENDENIFQQYEYVSSRYRLLGGYKLESEASRILKGLGFGDEVFGNPPSSLSGGWRMRLELAKIFLDKPDLLVLDEPTNHLDMPSLVWVESFIKNYEGTVLLVSHDKKLLNVIPTTIVHLLHGDIQVYKGNFDAFVEERDRRMADLLQQKSLLSRRREQMERFVERFGAKATKASQAQSRVKMIAKIRDLESEINIPDEDRKVQIKIPEVKPTGRISYEIKEGSIGYKTTLFSNLSLLIERGSRIAVIGANGVGKSTLIKTIAGEISPLKGEFIPGYQCKTGYFAQNQAEKLDGSLTVLNTVMADSDLGQLDSRSLLGAFLFSGEDVNKTISVLSGGEKSRVGMSVLMAQKPNFLILDEPTNHLDMSSVEALIMALSEFSGTLLFVSHDRYFVDEICTHVLVMYPDGQYLLYEGHLGDYERYAAERGLASIFDFQEKREIETPKDLKSVDYEEKKKEKRKLEKARRDLKKLEENITKLQAKVKGLDKALAEASPLDIGKLSSLSEDREKVQSELHTFEEQWLEISHEIEQSTAEE